MGTKLIAKLSNSEYSHLLKEVSAYRKKYTKFSNDFLMKNYGVKLQIPLKFRIANSTIMGKLRITEYSGNRAVANDIIINRVVLMSAIASNNFTNFEKILKHELIHYGLFSTGKPFKDGTELFETELDKYNSVHSSAVTSNCLFAPYILDNYVDDSNTEHLFKHKESNPIHYSSLKSLDNGLKRVDYLKTGVSIYA